jgi:hypothetical protein
LSGAGRLAQNLVAAPLQFSHFVITGLVPVIHVLLSLGGDKDVDGRVKPGHDEMRDFRLFAQ